VTPLHIKGLRDWFLEKRNVGRNGGKEGGHPQFLKQLLSHLSRRSPHKIKNGSDCKQINPIRGTNFVFVLEKVGDSFRHDPVEFWMKAIQATVHADSDARFIDTPNQRRNTCLTYGVTFIISQYLPVTAASKLPSYPLKGRGVNLLHFNCHPGLTYIFNF